MLTYLALIAVVFVANAVPAFAPPTWAILVWFELGSDMHAYWVIVCGVIAATAGRAVLSLYMRHSTRWMPHQYVANMESAGRYLSKTRGRATATLALFFVSPLSSAQLFTAAGIMHSVRLRPLLTAFALGRSVSYSLYVTGAHFAKRSSLGDVLLDAIKSPAGIAVQVLMIVAVVLLGTRHWNHD